MRGGWFGISFLASISVLIWGRLGMGQAAGTQPEAVTTETQASSAEVQRWLAAEDPRLVAWGAYFAGKSGDEARATEMLRLVERWPGRTDRDSTGPWESAMSMTAILDAFLEMHEAVPADGLVKVAREFPVQAAVLVTRLPAAEATPVLLDWYRESGNIGQDGALDGDLVRVAAMMLVKAPPPGFAASMLEGMEVRLQVWVTDPGKWLSGGSTGGSACGDGEMGKPPEGWPPLYEYGWEENAPNRKSSAPADPVLVEAGGDRITYRRRLAYEGFSSCYGVRMLNAETRRHLVAEMAGVGPDGLGWNMQNQASVGWRDAAQFQRNFYAVVNAEEGKLRATVDGLVARGAMTKAEAKSSRPRLSVMVTDSRTLGVGALPALVSDDVRTTIVYATE